MKKELIRYYIPYIDILCEYTEVKYMVNNYVYYSDAKMNSMIRYYNNKVIKIKGNVYDSVSLRSELCELYEKLFNRYLREKHYSISYIVYMKKNIVRDLMFYALKLYSDSEFRAYVRLYLYILS